MLLNQLMQLSPKMGGNWLPSLKWMFLTDVHTLRRNLTSNRFLLGIVRAWDVIKIFLHKQMRETWNVWMNQPLLANSFVRNCVGNVFESFYSDVNHSYTETQIKTKTREHTIYVENPDFREKPRRTEISTIRQ